MLLSNSFIPILKNNPSEAKIKSHQLMLRVGMIKQASAGIYSWLPLGFKVRKKIEDIVRQEQNKIGAQEILMPTIQSSEIWKESGRYDDYGEEMLRSPPCLDGSFSQSRMGAFLVMDNAMPV